ncbi:DUF1627 domain-containing protein [Serratia odorifera]|uniref:DUF1627 domain-containing protein n=2 Tax=Serratia odorifera TaxID=618 RepID=D4E7H0_SEROD|nr:DUF1627 domain-containing protein [Serratia odorifera]EFE94025.1 hypothetical protein HMPREF0758_4120 [Serratia odorifera DSM 4582]PNK89103.1 hypothetical protein CEQ31_004985 [Serratia odorifera]RII69867.1 DUF1627 domain-containing protein [Serratia odorifera]VDZ64172.1 Protein of uncharacterised function (DUF1627) [Serratia odorifera]
METIIDALKAMGKASSIEIAARLGLDRQEVIDQLWELKRADEVVQVGQQWAAVVAVSGNEKSEVATGMKADDLINIIAKQGSMTAEELAAAAGVTTRRVASSLAMATSCGKIERKSVGGKFRYMLPGKAKSEKIAAPAPAVTAVDIPAPAVSIAAPTAVQTQAVDAGTDTLVIPTIAHLRKRIRQQKAGARRDEQLLKYLVRVHRLMEVNS